MFKIVCLSLLAVLMGCETTLPHQDTTCINGDPGGSQRCQAKAYQQAR